jgi:hypothetical protein
MTKDSKEIQGNEANTLLAVRLIANFMGWVNSPYENLPNKVYSEDLTQGKHLDQFKYNELIPVVKKIQQLKLDEFSKKKPVMNALMDVEIESLFDSVVVFLQWWSKADR